jgi:excisionase family DNA binding protein
LQQPEQAVGALRKTSMTSNQQCEPLITLAQAAQLVNRPEKTLLRLAAAGEFPALKVGKCWRTRESLIDAWVNERIKLQREKSASTQERK